MKRIFVFLLFIPVLFSCNKNKFKTQPQVHIKSFGPAEVFAGENFRLDATVTDKEGDLQDSVLIVRKRFNITTNTLITVDTTLRFSLQDFGNPSQPQIELEAIFNYGQLIDGTIYQPLEGADRYFSVGIIIVD